MKRYEIWSEGYACTGDSSGAIYWGIEEAETFKEACKKFFGRDDRHKQYFRASTLTYWGCKLFYNEIAARKNFG